MPTAIIETYERKERKGNTLHHITKQTRGESDKAGGIGRVHGGAVLPF